MSAVRTFEPHRWLAGTLLVAYATVVALMRGPAQWAIAAIPPLVPALLWLVRSANAWLGLFFVVALLAPPLPSLVAEQLARLVTDAALRERVVDAGLREVAGVDWGEQIERVWAGVTKRSPAFA